MITIPFSPSLPDQSLTVPIGDEEYQFRALWNARAGAGGLWFLEVSQIDGTNIVRSVPIVLGTFLGRRSGHRLFVSGVLVAVAAAADQREAGLDDLGTRVTVRYFDQSEAIVALASAGFLP